MTRYSAAHRAIVKATREYYESTGEPIYCTYEHCPIEDRLIDLYELPNTQWSLTLDHIMAVADGGLDGDASNLTPMHKSCNSRKEVDRKHERKYGEPRRNPFDEQCLRVSKLPKNFYEPSNDGKGYIISNGKGGVKRAMSCPWIRSNGELK